MLKEESGGKAAFKWLEKSIPWIALSTD